MIKLKNLITEEWLTHKGKTMWFPAHTKPTMDMISMRDHIAMYPTQMEKMFGKVLVTHQTGKIGKRIERLYIEETCDIEKEFYLSCLIDRGSSKIAFISCAEGGMDIEQLAKKNPKKITTVRINFSKSVSKENVKKIVSIKSLLNSPLNNVKFNLKNVNKLEELSKKLTNNDGTSSIQIEVHDQDKKLTFKLKNKRQIDRKSVNLIKNKDISAIIN